MRAWSLMLLVWPLMAFLAAFTCGNNGRPEDDLAEAALLRLADFESYWEEEPPQDNDSPLTRRCNPRDRTGITGTAQTGTIHNGGVEVTQFVAVYEESPPVDRDCQLLRRSHQ